MADNEYYEILGIGRDAEISAIKKAYRKAAVRYHPDKNPGDAAAEENFKRAAEAYAVLSDPEKRRMYDQFGKRGVAGGQGFGGFDQEIFSDFGDILGDLFGLGSVFGGGRRRGRAVGRDLRYDLEIEFEEAVQGLETHIQLPRLEPCESCDGSGAEDGAIETCDTCRGQGQVAFQQGFFTIARTCGQCGGTGKQITRPCGTCNGNGRQRKERNLTIRIPPGVDEGTRMRMSGEGEAGPGGAAAGDLYVVLHVREHPVFIRDGRDIHVVLPLSFSQAALGAEVEVPTIDGPHPLTVPSGTQSASRFRIKGRGAPSVNGRGKGDQFVTVQIRTPTKLSSERKRLLEELGRLDGEEPIEPGLFDRVKNIFGS